MQAFSGHGNSFSVLSQVGFADSAATLPGLRASLDRMWGPLLEFKPPPRFPLPVVVAHGRADHCPLGVRKPHPWRTDAACAESLE